MQSNVLRMMMFLIIKLIFGDNLLALKALEQEYTGEIKCIYIDPIYNTGQALEHYDCAGDSCTDGRTFLGR